MKKWIYSLLLVCLTAWNVSAQADVNNEALQRRLEKELTEKSKTVSSIVCQFRQTKKMSFMSKPQTTNGTFYFKVKDKICMDYTLPKGDCLIMNEDRFIIITNGKQNVADARRNPMMKALKNMLTACMSGNISGMGIGSNSKVSYRDEDGFYVVSVGMDKKKTKGILKNIVLSFDKNDLSLSKLLMEEFSGDYTLYEFTKKQFNVPVADQLFLRD